jgi:very-short-patch-repair endonuclease
VDHNVVVEVDDWDSHQTRHAFRTDRHKGNELATHGLVLLRFTAEHLDDPPYVEHTLRSAGIRPE